MELIKWTKDKLEKINSIIDLGIVISIFSGITVFFIYWYKLTLMSAIGVPLSIAINVIEINSTDLIMNFSVVLLLIVLSIFSYFFIYKAKRNRKIKNLFKFILIAIFILLPFKFSTYKKIALILCLITMLLVPSIVIWLFKKRPTALIEKIFKTNKESEKLLVVLTETVYSVLIFVCVYLLAANLYLTIPMERQTIDNKVILYNSNSQYLVSDFTIKKTEGVNELRIASNSFELISKDNGNIKLNILHDVILKK